MIFEFLRGRVYGLMAPHGTGERQIMNVRLSCRRFCSASSHLLIRYARVEMNLASLSRLEELSRHPLLREGVRAVLFNLCYYSSVLALDIREFAGYVLQKFRIQHDNQLETSSPADAMSDEAFPENAKHARTIIDSWQLFVDDVKSDDPEMLKRQLVLWKAHAEYQQRYFQQQRLRISGTFLRSVSTIISALPNATEFRVHDDGFRMSMRGLVPFSQIHDEQALVDGMLLPHAWEKDTHFLDDPPFQVLFRLPGFLHRAGVTINAIEYELVIEDQDQDSAVEQDLPSEKDLHDITLAVQKLKRLDLCRRNSITSNSWMPEEPDDMKYTGKYIAAHLATASIQKLSLNLRSLWDWEENFSADFSILGILNLQSYPYLTCLSLSWITLDLVDLKHLFDPILVPLRSLSFDRVYLVTGDWREALGILRSKGSKLTTLIDLYGAECDSLPEVDRRAIFGGPIERPLNGLWTSKAEDYVRGNTTKNPLS